MREVDQELFDAVKQGSNFFKVKKNDSSDITSSDVAEKRLRKLVKYLDKEVAEMPSNTDRADKIFSEQDRRIDTIRTYQVICFISALVLGTDHPNTLKAVKALRAYHELFSIQNASIKSVKQGLYLPSFERRGIEIKGKCTAITRGLSQALFLQSNKSFLNNSETSAEIYERIAQGKQISKREEKEIFAFSKLLSSFERQLDSSTSSLPSDLIHAKGYKTLSNLSNYISGVRGDFAIHLVTDNHVVAIYRTGDDYAYFDCNTAFVSGLKSVDQLMEVVEKGIKSTGYKIEEKGLLVEHFDVTKANSKLSNEDKQILAKEIKTERQLLAEQDKELGLIKINGQELSRVQLYDFGTKIHVEGGMPVLINADMKLSSKKFQDHLDKKEVSMTASKYLGRLKNSGNVEGMIQATKVTPFEGSSSEIRDAEETRKAYNKPEPYLSGITISNQPMRARAPGN